MTFIIFILLEMKYSGLGEHGEDGVWYNNHGQVTGYSCDSSLRIQT